MIIITMIHTKKNYILFDLKIIESSTEIREVQ